MTENALAEIPSSPRPCLAAGRDRYPAPFKAFLERFRGKLRLFLIKTIIFIDISISIRLTFFPRRSLLRKLG
jgi:hypothetical protein